MKYAICITPSATRDYKSIPEREAKKINIAINELSANPRPTGYKKLSNLNAYRIRIGNFRVIYDIDDVKITVFVIRIRHRKEVYRNLR